MKQSPHVAFDQILWSHKGITIGTFTALLSHQNFTNTGPIENNIMVFSNKPVVIHKSSNSYIANQNTVTMYNRGEEYFRESLNSHGDFSHWIAFSKDVLESFNGVCGIDNDKKKPFQIDQIMNDCAVFLKQRQLFSILKSDQYLDRTEVFEQVSEIFDGLKLIETEHISWEPQKKKIYKIIEYISQNFHEEINIESLSKLVFLSPFHLCRIFKRHTGKSIHKYILELRLKQGLNKMIESSKRISDLAEDLNFNSHSHFSSSFKKHFGISPKLVRNSHF